MTPEAAANTALFLAGVLVLVAFLYYRRPSAIAGPPRGRWWSHPPAIHLLALLPAQLSRRYLGIEIDGVRNARYQLALVVLMPILIGLPMEARSREDFWLVAVSSAPVVVSMAAVVFGRFWLAPRVARRRLLIDVDLAGTRFDSLDVSSVVRARRRIRSASRMAGVLLGLGALFLLVGAAALVHSTLAIPVPVAVPLWTAGAIAILVSALRLPRRIRAGSTVLLFAGIGVWLVFLTVSVTSLGNDGDGLDAYHGFAKGITDRATDILFGLPYFWVTPEITFHTFVWLLVPLIAVMWNSPGVVARLGPRRARLCWAAWVVFFAAAASAFVAALALAGANERFVTAVVLHGTVALTFGLALFAIRDAARPPLPTGPTGTLALLGWTQDDRNRQRYSLLPRRRRIVAVAVLVLEALVLLAGFGLRNADPSLGTSSGLETDAALLLSAQLGIGSGLFFLLATRVHWWLRRLSLPSLDVVRAARPDVEPLLYLRAFEDDRIRLQHRGGQPWFARDRRGRFEIALAAAAWPIAPVVAIGEPGERRPSAGSVREYVADEHWRDRVVQRIRESALVLFLVGPPQSFQRDSTGLGWELATLMGSPARSNVLFLLPPLPEAPLDERWTAFSQAADHHGAAGLPPRAPDGCIAVMTRDEAGWLVLVGRCRDEHHYGAAVEVAHALAQRAAGSATTRPAPAVTSGSHLRPARARRT